MTHPREVVSRLVERGLLPVERIVEGDLAVSDASRRNRNYKVVSAHGPSFFVKHAASSSAVQLVSQEALVYDVLRRDAFLAAHVPACHGYDASSRLFVVELLKDCEPMPEHHARTRAFPPSLGEAMGRFLARLHALPLDAPTRAKLPRTQPPFFNLARPHLSFMSEVSGANVKVVNILQQFPDLLRPLDKLQAEWRAETLTHGDLKWDNCMVTEDPATGELGLKILDWESGALGDPAWDVGSIINDHVNAWLQSMPVTNDGPPERAAAMASYPLEQMLPALHAFWRTYADARNLAPAARVEFLDRSVRYGAARLVQSTFEFMQTSPRITTNAVVALQVAQNVLLRPRDALTQLLRFPPVAA